MATEQQLSDAIDGLKTALDSESGVIAQVVQEISDLANQASSQPVTQEQLDDLAVRAQTALTEAQQNLTDLQAASGGTPPTP